MAEAKHRKSREVEELHEPREDTAHAEVWTPPSFLESPPPREGMKQRWVSTSILGKEVPQHVMRRFREGWTPRSADTIPEDFPVPTISHGQFDGCVGVEGMILCELPIERAEARSRYFRSKTGRMEAFVDQALDNVETRGGIAISRSRKRSVSRGQRIADD
jgi:hypothetical protein